MMVTQSPHMTAAANDLRYSAKLRMGASFQVTGDVELSLLYPTPGVPFNDAASATSCNTSDVKSFLGTT